MPCQTIDIGGGGTAMVCGVPRRNRCFYCGKTSEFLCDFPVVLKKRLGVKKSCDRPLCGNCKMSGASENIDFCRHHYPLAKAAFERKSAKTQ